MLRGVLEWLTNRFGSGGEVDGGKADGGKADDGKADDAEADDEEREDARFVPSVLDASVRYAHGMSKTGVEREIATIEEEARRLEEHQRDD